MSLASAGRGEGTLAAGLASLARDLCTGHGATLRRAPMLGVMLCCHCLEILNKFFNKGVPLLHFALGPAKCLANPVAK